MSKQIKNYIAEEVKKRLQGVNDALLVNVIDPNLVIGKGYENVYTTSTITGTCANVDKILVIGHGKKGGFETATIDDVANAIAGSLSLANELRGNYLDFRRQPNPLRAPIVIPRWRQTDPLNPNTNWMMRR